MEQQLNIFDFGVEEPVIHFENLEIDDEIIDANLEDLDFNDEFTSIA